VLVSLRLEARTTAGPHPALILLHGFGADEHDLVPLGEPFQDRATVVLLRAPEPIPGYPGYQWYAMQGMGMPEPVSWLRALDALHTTLKALREDPTLDAPRLILGGFSQGALMSASFACRYPDFGLRGLVLLSGYLPDWIEVPPLDALPVFVGHGTQDPVLPFAWGDAMATRFETAGAAVERHGYPMGHAVSSQEMDDLATFIRRLW
jgi:phospholipase/carboxylesterase